MTQRESARRSAGPAWVLPLVAAVITLVLGAVGAACEVPTHADAYATNACSTGQTLCSGVCIGTQTDPNNCGSCGTSCPSTFNCVAGACACADGFTSCDGVCSDLTSDSDHCGACDNPCGVNSVCVTGGAGTQCQPVCPDTWTTCSNVCVDLKNDPLNCDACGEMCSPGDSCVNGACVQGCAAGETLCGTGNAAVCANVLTDRKHCGTTCVQCGTDEICSGGKCTCDEAALDFACGAGGACEAQGPTHCGPLCLDCTGPNSAAYQAKGICSENTLLLQGGNNSTCNYGQTPDAGKAAGH